MSTQPIEVPYSTPASTSTTAHDASALNRERMLSMVAGALGILMFVWGFLRWFNVGDGAHQQKYSGYAFATPSSAVVGLSLAAGLIAVLGATERRRGRGVPTAVPTGLAATSLLLAIAICLGKGEITQNIGSKVGIEIGLILALITAALQTLVLGMALASRHDERHHDTRGDFGRGNPNVTAAP
jgi:hypothetical protein